MKNKSDEEVIDFYLPLWYCIDDDDGFPKKIDKAKSFFDLPGYLKHNSENDEFIHYMTEDGKPFIKFTIQYSFLYTTLFNHLFARKKMGGMITKDQND